MEIDIDMNDLKEIEDNYEKLSKFLLNNFSSFSACALILQSVMSAVDDAKAQLKED